MESLAQDAHAQNFNLKFVKLSISKKRDRGVN